MRRRAFIGGLALASAARAAGPVGFRLPKPAAPAGSSFTPFDPATLMVWLDASEIVGLADDDAIPSWPDSSGNGYDYAQATGSKRPLYKTNIRGSLPVARFDGTDDSLTGAHAITVKTAVVVFKINGTPAQYSTVLGLQGAGSIETIYRDTSNTRIGTYQNGAGFGPAISGVGTGFLVASHTFDGSTSSLRIDGTTSSPVAGAWNTAWTSGEVGYLYGAGVGYMSCDVAHVLLYDSVLSAADLANLETYFATH